MQSFLQRHRVLLLHFSFWCVYLSFFVYQITSFRHRETDLGEAFFQAGIQVAFHMVVAYMNYFFFLPRFLERKNVGRYLLEFFVPFIIIMFVSMLRFAKDWFEFEARKKELENENLTAELNFLKEQINPHFLFNTLNNLYYLAFTQSPNTTEVIAKLSQMMRYMIYDSNYQQVLLTKEIEYMKNYISLERLRLNDEVPIDFVVEGEVENKLITPLIFITFLENAFKHGVSANNPESWVKINIRVVDNECTYTVENTKLK